MKNLHLVCTLVAAILLSPNLLAVQGNGGGVSLNTTNCVASKWIDSNGNPISIDEKFGAGSLQLTRCLRNTRRVKALYQINTLCSSDACQVPYAVGNIVNQINDYEITHGMDSDDYRIIVIVHGAGWKLVLDNNALVPHSDNNPFQAAMQDLISRPSITVLFSQNTAHQKGIVKANLLEGIGFVTSAVSAIVDLQQEGYRYIQP